MRYASHVMVVSLAVLGGCALEGATGGGGSSCKILLAVETQTAVVGAAVSVQATSSISGFLDVDWDLRFDDQPVTCSDDTSGECIGTSIVFVPRQAGPYTISVSGTVDGSNCSNDSVVINVSEPGADIGVYTFRATPPQVAHGATIAPALAMNVAIPTGADYVLGNIRLMSPQSVEGVVSANELPIEAYVVATSELAGANLLSDAFSSSTLGYQMTLGLGSVDVDILPIDSSIAPLRLVAADTQTLGSITLPLATRARGIVRSIDGDPLADSSVSFTIDGLASALATTRQDGNYALDARAEVGLAALITVVPPSGSGLPTIRGSIDEFADDAVVDVAYNNALGLTERTLLVTDAANQPIAGARLLFVSDSFDQAASVTVNGNEPRVVGGVVRWSATTSATGMVAAAMLTDSHYSVYVSPPQGNPAVIALDLTAAITPTIKMPAQPARLRGRIVAGAAALTNVRVVARPSGLFLSVAPAPTTMSATDGTFELPVAGGVLYNLVIERRTDRLAGVTQTRFASILSPATGGVVELGDLTASPGRAISGSLRFASGAPASRTHLAIYCTDCPLSNVPLAQTISTASGGFVLLIPDLVSE